MPEDVFAALEAEQDGIARMLSALDPDAWARPSACAGWTVADVVLHLAQTEEAVAATVAGEPFPVPPGVSGGTIDELMASWVASERDLDRELILDRWDAARRIAVKSLVDADPASLVVWAAAPLKSRTLATTRLSEHWIHAHDIADPLGIDLPDTDRLWHIARLAQRTIPFAFGRAGRGDAPSVRAELTGPTGEGWTFGDADADVVIAGSAAEFCRIAARRLEPDEASISATGERAPEVLELIRTYA